MVRLADTFVTPKGLLRSAVASALFIHHGIAAPNAILYRDDLVASAGEVDPFAIIDPQNWVNPDNMTWDDWNPAPGTNWSDTSRKGSNRNFNIALVTVDYDDLSFTILEPVGSTVFGNPQPVAATLNLTREGVPQFYRDFYNRPDELNQGHTLHEYWMGDSGGRFGVDLTAFGPYRLPSLSYQYGISNDMNPNECPTGKTCNLNIRNDALGAWRAQVGEAVASSFELVFILSAGQDESSTWQEFGEMKFQTKEDVPDSFGPPKSANSTDTNWAKTRYVEWSSWAAAATFWPNAGGGSSVQAESSGMGTYAHELSHLLNIGDNYNNPYGVPLRRSYTGPWSMLSRGSFNGPGGPHTRWQIPPRQGGTMGSLHTLRDKAQIGLIGQESILHLSREALSTSGLIVGEFIARSVVPGPGELIGMRVAMDADLSPNCSIETDVFCDGGGYNNYDIEVIDRMGPDSFTPDSGVMISKTKDNAFGTYQWTIDANPQDIRLLDFHRPDGTPVYITLGDFRQLADALFHAGTRSGSEYEFVDKSNNLHFYILNMKRSSEGVLSYTTAVRGVDATSPHKHKVALSPLGRITNGHKLNAATQKGLTCSFQLSNKGTFTTPTGNASHPQDVSAYLKKDVYRLEAEVKGKGWKVELPNALATASFGGQVIVDVAIGAEDDAALIATVKLTATSESNPNASASGWCVVNKYLNL